MATLDERYGQLWWDPAAGAVQDDRPGMAPAPTRDFLPDSTNLYRDEAGTIRNLRSSEAAPAPQAAPGFAMSPLAARYAESQREGGAKLDDPFGIAAGAYRAEQSAAEMRAYQMANHLSQFLPPERVVGEVRRLTGVDLGGRLASTPNMMKRQEDEAGLRKTKAETAETEEKAAAKATERREAPIAAYAALDDVRFGARNMESIAKQIQDDPNLWRAAGPVAGRLPAMTPGTANIEAKIKTLKAQVGFSVLQAMRDASKTGGALGNVSEKEIDFLQNAIDALDLTQSPEQLRQSLDTIQRHTQRIRLQADRAYADKHLPVAARGQLREGVPARFANGQVWKLENGIPVRMH